MKDLSVSVSIVYYDTDRETFIRSLNSLCDALERLRINIPRLINFEIVIVNNSAKELQSFIDFNGFSILAEPVIDFRILQGQGNIGYGAGHNLALSSCGGQFHLLMNPDVIVEPEALTLGINMLHENIKTAALSPLCHSPQGVRQYLCKRYPSVLDLILRGFAPQYILKLFERRLSNYEMRDLDDVATCAPVDIVSGCFVFCRRSALMQVSGFNPRFFLYFEDFDLSLRLRAFGYLLFAPNMRVVHYGGNASRKGLKHILHFLSSAIKFYNTHGWRFY